MKMTNEIDKWTQGMAQFRKLLKQPKKDSGNDFVKSRYVSLGGIIDAADSAISTMPKDNAITYTQDVVSDTDKNMVSVTTVVLHVSGQWVQFGPLNVPVAKEEAQKYGSAVTYAKRYALSAALGISSEVDDDEAVGKNNNYSNNYKKPYQQNQQNTISKKKMNIIVKNIETKAGSLNIDSQEVYGLVKNRFKFDVLDNISNKMADQILVYLNGNDGIKADLTNKG